MTRSNGSYRWSRRKRTLYALRRSKTLLRLVVDLALSRRGSGSRQVTINKMCDFMVAAGGVYIKFLQGVLLGVPEVRQWLQSQSIDFFENVPLEALDVAQILQEELADATARLRLWPDPIASGTFAQVYAGLLDVDKPVIIKIQRYSIRPSLKIDVWLLQKFARFGKPFLTSLDADIGPVTRDFARLTLAEMDYLREARLGETLREQLHNAQPDVIVPRTYRELSSQHVLVQDRLGGVSVAELARSPEPLTAAQRRTLQEMATTVLLLPFTTGLVHADPHPGNLRLIGEQFGLLDFGAVDDNYVNVNLYTILLEAVIKAIDGTMTAAEALNAYFAAYAPRLYHALDMTSHALGLPSVVNLFASYSLGTQANKPQSSFKGNLRALADINKLVNPNNRFALKTSIQNVAYARAVHTMMQTMQLLGLKDELVAALHAINERIPALRQAQQPEREVLSIAEAKEIVYNWLEKVVERNPLMAGELRRAFNALQREPETPSTTQPDPKTT